MRQRRGARRGGRGGERGAEVRALRSRRGPMAAAVRGRSLACVRARACPFVCTRACPPAPLSLSRCARPGVPATCAARYPACGARARARARASAYIARCGGLGRPPLRGGRPG